MEIKYLESLSRKQKNILRLTGICLILLSTLALGWINISEQPKVITAEDLTNSEEPYSRYIYKINFNEKGEIESYVYDSDMGKTILQTRNMTTQQKLDFLNTNFDVMGENKESSKKIIDQSLALLYVDNPKLLIAQFDETAFSELQIVEILYRIEIGQSQEEILKIAQAQKEQLGIIDNLEN